ncbi:MAG: LytTR family DNA-binding domain-containing protein [Kangiellaceae bacterium]|jgi:two-component system response regulator AlgR|nr:LytTR family DNA-binding domain-containing protein [Kangiellaceae bacterium]
MNILITDDEPLAQQRLIRLLQELGDFTVATANNGVEAVNYCTSHNVDLVLMDIRMPDMDGLEAAMHLAQLPTSPAVVFVTAYDDYALKAFSVNAVDYLLKPIGPEQLSNALQKAQKLNSLQLSNLQNSAPDLTERKHISARLGGDVQLIPITDIYYFQADQKYVNIHHRRGEALIEQSLKQLEHELSPRFLRIHRNALVNLDHINGLTKDNKGHLFMTFKSIDDQLEISRRHASEVRKIIRSL